MSRAETEDRPKGIPATCERGAKKKNEQRCGGRIIKDEDQFGVDWHCATCGKSYMPYEERRTYIKDNWRIILTDKIKLGYIGCLKTHPIKPKELKELKEAHSKEFAMLKANYGKTNSKPRNRQPRLPNPREVSSNPEHNNSSNGLPTLKEMVELIPDFDKDVQLKLLTIYDKQWDCENKIEK